uniref:Uncharacterized protein n=1 Tax=Strongyloides papillosus TaxID=174720 RepID=A0A0N5BYB7_STREA
MKINFKLVIVVILIFVPSSIERRRRFKLLNVAVTGTLLCDRKPYKNVDVALGYSLDVREGYT